MDVKSRVETAKINLRRAENAKTIAETQKETAEKSLKDITAKMVEQGVSPDTIQDEIIKLEVQINQDLETIENLIPEV